VSGYHATTERLVAEARRSEQMAGVLAEAAARGVDSGDLGELAARLEQERDPEGRHLLEQWAGLRAERSFEIRPGTT